MDTQQFTNSLNRIKGLTEGRIVHYVEDGGFHRAAMVVKVWSHETGVCNLEVKNEDATTYLASSRLPDFEGKAPGTWHWIEPA
jgi:hypothetical protein